MEHWAYDTVFYHIYPLGLCGAPLVNDFCTPPTARLEVLYPWIDHMRDLGINALYLGPLFESTSHGYDTADYFHVDRRLGSNQTLTDFSTALQKVGIRLILDGVFNHVGRDFWAFRDVRERGAASAYCGWFQGLRFGQTSPFNDPFCYEGWNGHYNLVKLNLSNPLVKEHLFQAIATWVREFDIAGLRLDVADCLDPAFIRELAAFCRGLRSDFWLMGEVIHGDYRRWANPQMLDSVTNYECYKGLFSSLVDKNYYEIAYALNRQFGQNGLYRDIPLYNFADNHDVNRIASNLRNERHLYPLYCLLFTMPGIPSIYYGSEWGIAGKRSDHDDRPLRPHLDLAALKEDNPHPDLPAVIARLAMIRRTSTALRYGIYRQLSVRHEQFAFLRETTDERVVVLLNAAERTASFDLPLPDMGDNPLVDRLNPGETFRVQDGRAQIEMAPCWARILLLQVTP